VPLNQADGGFKLYELNHQTNNAMNNKSYLKSELAEMADVSYSSFYRFLRSRRTELTAMGCPLNGHKIRGKVLKYICEEYNIQLPEEEPEVKKHIKFR
jgi:hypothetical protein